MNQDASAFINENERKIENRRKIRGCNIKVLIKFTRFMMNETFEIFVAIYVSTFWCLYIVPFYFRGLCVLLVHARE